MTPLNSMEHIHLQWEKIQDIIFRPCSMISYFSGYSWRPYSKWYCVLPLAGSLAGSPHLSELSINSQGGPAVANTTLSPNLSPDNRQASPLVSPLLNDQSGVRTDDEEDVRRKVLIWTLPYSLYNLDIPCAYSPSLKYQSNPE